MGQSQVGQVGQIPLNRSISRPVCQFQRKGLVSLKQFILVSLLFYPHGSEGRVPQRGENPILQTQKCLLLFFFSHTNCGFYYIFFGLRPAHPHQEVNTLIEVRTSIHKCLHSVFHLDGSI